MIRSIVAFIRIVLIRGDRNKNPSRASSRSHSQPTIRINPYDHLNLTPAQRLVDLGIAEYQSSRSTSSNTHRNTPRSTPRSTPRLLEINQGVTLLWNSGGYLDPDRRKLWFGK